MASRREGTEAGVAAARIRWESAPQHVKAMAGEWVLPVFAAMQAIDQELRYLARQIPGESFGSEED